MLVNLASQSHSLPCSSTSALDTKCCSSRRCSSTKKSVLAPTPAYRIAEPIVEATTRNVSSGQLSAMLRSLRRMADASSTIRLSFPLALPSLHKPPQITSRPPLWLAGYIKKAAPPVALTLLSQGAQPKGSLTSASNSTKPKQNSTIQGASLPTTPMIQGFVSELPSKFSEMQLRTPLKKHGGAMTHSCVAVEKVARLALEQ